MIGGGGGGGGNCANVRANALLLACMTFFWFEGDSITGATTTLALLFLAFFFALVAGGGTADFSLTFTASFAATFFSVAVLTRPVCTIDFALALETDFAITLGLAPLTFADLDTTPFSGLTDFAIFFATDLDFCATTFALAVTGFADLPVLAATFFAGAALGTGLATLAAAFFAFFAFETGTAFAFSRPFFPGFLEGFAIAQFPPAV